MSKLGDKALENFDIGFNCAESVFLAATVEKSLGLGEDAVKLASAFGGGLGHKELCGAAAGAAMAIGAVHGRTKADQDRGPSKNAVTEYIKEFKEKLETTKCEELTSSFEFNSNERREHCRMIVKVAAELLENKI
jgi:C_GCAxxG_C_C family probable redox protein